MRKTLAAVALIALVTLVTGCPDSNPMLPGVDVPDTSMNDGVSDLDGIEDPDLSDVLEDVPDVSDGQDQVEPDADLPPLPPELSFCLMTPTAGCVGADGDQVNLIKNDEASDDLYPETPELEVDVQVTTANVAPGTTVSLSIDGNQIADQVLPGDLVSFAMVHLSHAVEPTCHTVEVAVDGLISETKTVCVDTGTCGVTLLPSNQGCITEDQDVDAAGFQVLFTVTNGNTDCDLAWLETPTDTTDPVALVDGEAEIMVTLSETVEGLECQSYLVTASVSDTNDDTRTASLELDYTLDTVAPTLTIDTPMPGTVNLGDDLDGDPDNGIQIALEGTATGLGIDDEITVTVDGDEVAVISAEGAQFTATITLDQDGLHEIAVLSSDTCCGQEATDMVEVVSLLAPANVMILSPLNGASLLAADDDVPGTNSVMNTDFLIFAPLVTEGAALKVQCRRAQTGSLWKTVGTMTVAALNADSQYEVGVLIDVKVLGQQILCRASDGGTPPAISPEVTLALGIPPGLLVITAPDDGEIVAAESFTVVGATADLNGQPVTLSLAEGGIDAWTEEVTSDALGFTQSADLSDLAEGTYTLTAAAMDQFGNDAAATLGSLTQLTIELDSAWPGLTLVAPLAGANCDPIACPDVDPGLSGHQIAVQVMVTGEAHPELAEACLSFNSEAPICVAPGADGAALYSGLTITPETNTLDFTITDVAGHMTTPAQETFTFDIEAPKVTITQPSKDMVVAAQPVPVTVSVASPDGLTPLDDATVTLWTDDVQFGSLNAGPGGIYTFALDGLVPGAPIEIHATATHPTELEIGHSSFRTILLKEGTPSITFTAPTDGAVLNLATAGCANGVPGCSLTVTAATENAENGSPAVLTVDCGIATQIPGTVQGNLVTWSGVVLSNNATCTLNASVEDLAGQTGDAAPVVVTVDRTAPVLTGFVQPNFELMPAALDEDETMDGYQFTVVVGLQGVEAGQSMDLEIVPEIGQSQFFSVVLDAGIPDGQTQNISFPQSTFDEGLNQLVVTVADLAGNPDGISFTVNMFLEATQVRLDGSDYIPYETCVDDDDCDAPGICKNLAGGNKCVFPWSAKSQKVDATSQPQNLFSNATSPLRLCSAHPSLAAQGAPLCQTTDGPVKFREIKSSDHSGGVEFMQFTAQEIGALPEGHHRVVAEALADTGEWVLSIDTPNFAQQERHYWLDLEAPVVTDLAFPDDIQPPLGTLNQGELHLAPNTFQATVDLAGEEIGSLEIWDNSVLIATVNVDGAAEADLTLDLFEGLNMLQVLATDQVGNLSQPYALDVTVDTVAPVLSFTAPAASPLLVGSSPDAVLMASGTDGTNVHLERKIGNTWVELSVAPVDGMGAVTFGDVLAQDGEYTLRGRVRDSANNETIASTSPAVIVVDRMPPDATLLEPTTGTTFTDGDDAAPAMPGFQFTTEFEVSGAANWTILLATCPDATFTGCAAGVTAAAGVLPSEALTTISEFITVGAVDEATEFRQVQVVTEDSLGNTLALSANITLTFTACQVSFTDAPATGWYNTDLCDPPGQDCQTITTALTASFTTGCGVVEEIRLYEDGGVNATLPVTMGSGVSFPLSLDHGDSMEFEARLIIGGNETGDTTGPWPFAVDLTVPTAAFTAPTPGTSVLAQANDLNPGTPGCQIAAGVDVEGDNVAGGTLVLTTATGGAEATLGDVVMGNSPFSYTWPSNITLEEHQARTLTATATDAAGNSGTTSLTINVDVTPPGAIDLKTIDPASDTNPRRPAVTLNWETVGDDAATGGAAASYEVRYSTAPITPANFDQACDTSSLSLTEEPPTPGEPGGLDTFTITGPDDRAPSDPCRFVTGTSTSSMFYFAVRAYDEVGNASVFATENAESTNALRLFYTQVLNGTFTDGNIDAHPVTAGDVNNDGREDLLLGSYGENGFCLMLGREAPPATIDLSTDPLTQCLFDSVASQVGYDLAGLGDVNGDGYDDVAVVSYMDDDSTGRTRVRVYLGGDTGLLSTTPEVTFTFGTTGLFWTNFVPISGAGNFNGDMQGDLPIHDILVATPQTNTVYVIPGNPNWGMAPVEFDLESPVDRAAANVLEITMTGGAGADWFGMGAAGVGDVLLEGDGQGQQYDDIVVSQYDGPTAAFVVRGRDLTGGASITLSPTLDGSGSDDATSVRLLGQGTIADFPWFFGQIKGEDLDCDGLPEIVGTHLQAAAHNGRSIYIFRGDAVADALGETLTIGPAPEAGTALVGAGGTIIKGNYQGIGLIGNFDDSPIQAECSSDLVYGDYNGFSNFGSVYFRYNLPGVQGMASFQELDLTVTDPYTPGNLDFGGFRLAPLDDFTGDGFPDLMVGTDGSGYLVLIR